MDFPKSVPGVGLVGGQFVDENPSIGQQGSLIPAAWGNAVTQELLAVIREAGIEPDEDQTDQLRMAIRSMWATVEKPGVLRKASSADMLDADCDDAAVTPEKLRAGFSWAVSGDIGYIAFPSWMGGWIIQAGKSQTGVTNSFPIAFPNILLAICGNHVGAGYDGVAFVYSATNNTTFRCIKPSTTSVEIDVRWIAIGR